MASLKPSSVSSIMFYFRSPPKPPKTQPPPQEDIEAATPPPPPRRGVTRHVSSRADDSALHQRRHHLEQQMAADHSNSSDHHNETLVCSSSSSSLNNSHLHVHHAAAPVSGALFLQPQHSTKNSQTASIKTTGLTSQQQQQSQQAEVVLLHPILHKVPLQFRFGVVGALSNILFMVVYNLAVSYLEQQFTPSTLYSIVYFFYIPMGHLLVSLLVFGWPERYLASLMSNFPIGLTAMAIGSALTAYCDYKSFDERVEEYIRDNFTFSHMPSRPDEAPSSEFYTSILVLVVTSLWTYVLSVYINAPPASSDKKEL